MHHPKSSGAAASRKRRPVPAWVIVSALLAAVLAGACLFEKTGEAESLSENPGVEFSAPTAPSAETAGVPAAIPLPYPLEAGSLELTSLFRYTGLNPDCGWAEGTGIGAVVLTNRSQQYLQSLTLALTLTDGTELSFAVSDLPAGRTVWAFETGNGAFDDTAGISDVRYSADLRESGDPPPVTASADGMTVTLTNTSREALDGLSIQCHSVLDGVYFGGTSYSYLVEAVPAGGSASVFAADCFLGEAEAASVRFGSQPTQEDPAP